MRRLIFAICVFSFLCHSLTPFQVVAQKDAQAPALTKEQWREDLRYFARELPKRHKNLYHATSQEQFERAVAELDAAIPSLQAHQIIVRMHQIAATVGDGHTGVHLPPYFKRYPIRLFWFGRELRVIAAAREYQDALGARVVKLGALSIDEAQARILSCFPSAENENEWYVMGTSPAFIIVPEVLHALGIVSALEHAPFTFEDERGKQFTLEISPVEFTIVGGSPTLRLLPAAREQPLYRQKPGERFWFTHLPDSQTVYVSFRGYGSLGENARKLFQFIDGNPTKRLVISPRISEAKSPRFLERAKEMLQQCFLEPLSLSEIALAVGVHPSILRVLSDGATDAALENTSGGSGLNLSVAR